MIKIAPLRGLVPKADGKDIVGQAEIAENIDFSDGYARPWCTPVQLSEAPTCGTPHLYNGRLRFGSQTTTFHTDSVNGMVYTSDPCDCPRVYKDWCNSAATIALGLPLPATPTITGESVVADDYTDLVSVRVKFINENCPGCPEGPASAPSNTLKCNKEDTFTVTIPQPDSKYEVTHIEIYRLATTWDASQGLHDSGTDGFVGNNIFGGHDTAVSAQYFLAATVEVGVTTATIDCSMPTGRALQFEDNFAPPDGMCIDGETIRGSLVGHFECHLLFSQRNHYHAFPQSGVMSFGQEIDTVCVDNETVYVLLKDGNLYVVLDDVTGAEVGECRSTRLITKTRRTASCGTLRGKQHYCDASGFTWITDEGIMRVSPAGQLVNLTYPWFGYSEWRNTLPSEMTMAVYRGAIFFSSPAYSGVLDMNARGDIATDTFQPNHSTLSICPECWYEDCDGRLYFIVCNVMYEFNAGPDNMLMRWKSTLQSQYGVYSVGLIDFFGKAKNESLGRDGVFVAYVYAKGQCTQSSVQCSRDQCCFRLKRSKGHDIQLEYSGRESVRALCAAATMTAITNL